MTGPNFRETNDNFLDHDRHLARNLGQPGNPKRVRKDSWKELQVVNPYHAAKTRLRNKPDRVKGSCKAGKVVKVKNASKESKEAPKKKTVKSKVAKKAKTPKAPKAPKAAPAAAPATA